MGLSKTEENPMLIILSLMLLTFFPQNQPERGYAIYVPSGYDPDQPTPLVIALHASGGSAGSMAQITGFNDMAERDNVLVLYPEGPYGYWDYGAGTPNWENVPNLLDDPAYIRDLLENIESEYNIDPTRIYAAGFSNGSRMAFRVACDLPDKIAAIAAVAATLSDEVTPLCDHGKPVSVLFMHGTRDHVIPPYAKRLHIDNLFISNALSARGTAEFWEKHNECEETETEVITADDLTINLIKSRDCNGGAEVDFYEVLEGRHVWNFTEDFNTSELIWTFFREHVKEN